MCGVCEDVIDSKDSQSDVIFCKCGEIYIDGSNDKVFGARKMNNFMIEDVEGKWHPVEEG